MCLHSLSAHLVAAQHHVIHSGHIRAAGFRGVDVLLAEGGGASWRQAHGQPQGQEAQAEGSGSSVEGGVPGGTSCSCWLCSGREGKGSGCHCDWGPWPRVTKQDHGAFVKKRGKRRHDQTPGGPLPPLDAGTGLDDSLRPTRQ